MVRGVYKPLELESIEQQEYEYVLKRLNRVIHVREYLTLKCQLNASHPQTEARDTLGSRCDGGHQQDSKISWHRELIAPNAELHAGTCNPGPIASQGE
jgi:hypothetical protein